MSVFIRFERGRDDVVGPTLGPFEWVQQTYQDLRVSPDGETLAQWVGNAGEWFIIDGEHAEEFYSDFVIYDRDTAEPFGEHCCVNGKRTVGDDGVTEQWWDGDAWAPTGRVWNTGTGVWETEK